LVPSALMVDGQAIVVMLYGPCLGHRFPLHGRESIIGRKGEVDIIIDSDSVSRRHARICRAPDGSWFVEDLGSRNGTWVNEERVTRRGLGHGDMLRFGGAMMKFLTGPNVEAGYHDAIYQISMQDALTGFHNRRYFLEILDREMAGARRHLLPLSVVLFDIDHMRRINEAHGFLAGDAVLAEIGRRLRPRVRREDLLARIGGEEFACVLTKTPRGGAMAFGETLRRMVNSQPFPHERTALPVTISLGVIEYDGGNARHHETVEPLQLLKRAEENVAAAKINGRDRLVG
jgi:two-component system, cell cycle response regulator